MPSAKGAKVARVLPKWSFNKYSKQFWINQENKDFEINIGHNSDLYAIWYEKKEFVLEQLMKFLNADDKKLEKAISTGTAEKQNVTNRFEIINTIIVNSLNHD